jgi:hypothetical protein
MSSVSVRLVERGDGEDGVSIPGRRAEVSPRAEAAAYATDPELCSRQGGHDIPAAINSPGHQRGHDLSAGLKTQAQ